MPEGRQQKELLNALGDEAATIASLQGVAGPPSVLGTFWRRRLAVHAAAWLVSQVGARNANAHCATPGY
ncbi:hypothetical protein [Beijerinckia indica]|uniref:hypothetical protein n=1 Tax=Beijerinckia indica TaxID=533 RepID=UPI0002DD16C3|nr:hypothetical protein [Beijerinckia indica]